MAVWFIKSNEIQNFTAASKAWSQQEARVQKSSSPFSSNLTLAKFLIHPQYTTILPVCHGNGRLHFTPPGGKSAEVPNPDSWSLKRWMAFTGSKVYSSPGMFQDVLIYRYISCIYASRGGNYLVSYNRWTIFWGAILPKFRWGEKKRFSLWRLLKFVDQGQELPLPSDKLAVWLEDAVWDIMWWSVWFREIPSAARIHSWIPAPTHRM